MRPLILITNDDGIDSPGLHAAAESLADYAELLIAAPIQQQTGMSRALFSDVNSGVIYEKSLMLNGQQHPAYAIQATPALTVVHAVLELASRIPDLCVSGINYGENVGRTISASGTVGAALEASAFHIPAIAISRGAPLAMHRSKTYGQLDWKVAGAMTAHFARTVIEMGLPDDVDALNINVPEDAHMNTEIRFTTQSRQAHMYYSRPGLRAHDQPMSLPLKYAINSQDLEVDSDIQAFYNDRVISVTALRAYLDSPIDLLDRYSKK